MASVLLEEILNHLKILAQEERYKQQSAIALELFNRIILTADISQPQLANLAVNLWNLAQKQGCLDPKLAVSYDFSFYFRRPDRSLKNTSTGIVKLVAFPPHLNDKFVYTDTNTTRKK